MTLQFRFLRCILFKGFIVIGLLKIVENNVKNP